MKIRFLDSVAGANFAFRRNQVVDMRVDLAKGFIKARQAVEVVDEPVVSTPVASQVEVAVTVAPENTAAGKRSRRGRGLIKSMFG